MYKIIIISEFILHFICLIFSIVFKEKFLFMFITYIIVIASINLFLVLKLIKHKDYLKYTKCDDFSESHQYILFILSFYPFLNIAITLILIYQHCKYLAWKYY